MVHMGRGGRGAVSLVATKTAATRFVFPLTYALSSRKFL